MNSTGCSILEEIKLNAWTKHLSAIHIFNLQNRNRSLNSQNHKKIKKPKASSYPFFSPQWSYFYISPSRTQPHHPTPARPEAHVSPESATRPTEPSRPNMRVPAGTNRPTPPWCRRQKKPWAPQNHPLALCPTPVTKSNSWLPARSYQPLNLPVPVMAHSTQNYDLRWVAKWGKLTFYEV